MAQFKLSLNQQRQDDVLQYIKWCIVSVAIVVLILAFMPFLLLKLIFDVLSMDGNFSLLTPTTVVIFRAFFITVALILLAYVTEVMSWGRLYALILAFLYSIICSAQVLGFFRIYRLDYILPFVLSCTVILFFIYDKFWLRDFHAAIFQQRQKSQYFSYVLWGIGICLLILLILAPLFLWPYSPVNPELAWDVGKYHWPKALELANTGSAWDLTISYGEYPYGYESLFSFAALLNRDGMLFGSMHAIGVLFFVLTFWLLLCRHTNLQSGLNFLLVVCVLISGLVWMDESNNIWWIYHTVIYDTIGKNDLFLAASVLAILLHAPINTKTEKVSSWHMPGMAIATMIALSVKPNAVFVIVPIWGWAIFQYLRVCNRLKLIKNIAILFGYGFLILPGALWILRNLIAQGMIFSSFAMRLQDLSILSNLTNAKLYAGVTPVFIVTLVMLVSTFFMALYQKSITWIFWIVFLILFLSFISSPASGFVHPRDEYGYFSWRFGVALLTFVFISIMIMLDSWLIRFTCWLFDRRVATRLFLLVITGGLALLIVWNGRWYFLPTLSNVNVLTDQYRQPIGVDGYNSAFDYIHKNVRYSVVRVENGLPFYAYGSGFTNSTTFLKPPDYTVILRTAWLRRNEKLEYPPKLDSALWIEEWQLVYEDSEGRVYKKR